MRRTTGVSYGWFLLAVVFLCISCAFTQETEVVDDIKFMKDIQKMLLDSGFKVQVNLPILIYYIGKPPHFKDDWAGLTSIKNNIGRVEVRLTGTKEFDMDTFYHEMFHWFVLDVDIKGFEERASRFAKACNKEFKNKLTKGLWEIWYEKQDKQAGKN